MARPASVVAYLSAQPPAARAILRRVRRAIRKALPAAAEVLSYQIPTYKVDGRAVIYFAAWRRHYAIYPAGDRLVAAFRDELLPYKRVKSTLHFPYDRPVPEALIARLARFRAQEVTLRAKGKTQSTRVRTARRRA
jgi:uncharacterized protein YdhG (YjbR/CyaY superfamily)